MALFDFLDDVVEFAGEVSDDLNSALDFGIDSVFGTPGIIDRDDVTTGGTASLFDAFGDPVRQNPERDLTTVDRANPNVFNLFADAKPAKLLLYGALAVGAFFVIKKVF